MGGADGSPHAPRHPISADPHRRGGYAPQQTLMAESNYVTPEGARKLRDELVALIERERPKVVEEVAEAAAQGDRSENAEYIYGKKRLREIDRRIRFLTKRLDAAVVVSPDAQEGETVFFGAKVEVEYDDGRRCVYHLVGQDESEPERGRISYKSPIGRALLRRSVGECVVVQRPAGEVELEIVGVTY